MLATCKACCAVGKSTFAAAPPFFIAMASTFTEGMLPKYECRSALVIFLGMPASDTEY